MVCRGPNCDIGCLKPGNGSIVFRCSVRIVIRPAYAGKDGMRQHHLRRSLEQGSIFQCLPGPSSCIVRPPARYVELRGSVQGVGEPVFRVCDTQPIECLIKRFSLIMQCVVA